MIDQASVFADRFRNNRQALQAAVLGQNSGVDPYTALRALQLLKESDSMQMAQQGQQPTEAPSLLQEAMQPPQMPMGMAVPGQQMSQAPQQSGGLEAMPLLGLPFEYLVLNIPSVEDLRGLLDVAYKTGSRPCKT
jgi:hypothetical protein